MSSTPDLIPRAITPSAMSGSNIRGKIVTKSNLIEPLGQRDDDALSREVDRPADLGGERDVELLAVPLDLQQHAAPTLVSVDHAATLRAVFVDQREADEIVQEVL